MRTRHFFLMLGASVFGVIFFFLVGGGFAGLFGPFVVGSRVWGVFVLVGVILLLASLAVLAAHFFSIVLKRLRSKWAEWTGVPACVISIGIAIFIIAAANGNAYDAPTDFWVLVGSLTLEGCILAYAVTTLFI